MSIFDRGMYMHRLRYIVESRVFPFYFGKIRWVRTAKPAPMHEIRRWDEAFDLIDELLEREGMYRRNGIHDIENTDDIDDAAEILRHAFASLNAYGKVGVR